MKAYIFSAVLIVSGCTAPSAYKAWDKDLSAARAEVADQSVQGIIDSVYPYFDYRRDEFDVWEVPKPNQYGRYSGDCEDYAALIGGRLQQAGIPFRFVHGVNFYQRECCDGPPFRAAGHLMIQLHDGRYIDNYHPEPFSRPRHQIVWRSPEY